MGEGRRRLWRPMKLIEILFILELRLHLFECADIYIEIIFDRSAMLPFLYLGIIPIEKKLLSVTYGKKGNLIIRDLWQERQLKSKNIEVPSMLYIKGILI